MSQSIRVLIGDDSLELGISWATAFKEAGLYAITRPKMGKVLAVICALLGILITKSIVNPMNEMVKVAREIQEGDRDKRLDIKTHNEFKDISELYQLRSAYLPYLF